MNQLRRSRNCYHRIKIMVTEVVTQPCNEFGSFVSDMEIGQHRETHWPICKFRIGERTQSRPPYWDNSDSGWNRMVRCGLCQRATQSTASIKHVRHFLDIPIWKNSVFLLRCPPSKLTLEGPGTMWAGQRNPYLDRCPSGSSTSRAMMGRLNCDRSFPNPPG